MLVHFCFIHLFNFWRCKCKKKFCSIIGKQFFDIYIYTYILSITVLCISSILPDEINCINWIYWFSVQIIIKKKLDCFNSFWSRVFNFFFSVRIDTDWNNLFSLNLIETADYLIGVVIFVNSIFQGKSAKYFHYIDCLFHLFCTSLLLW